MYPNHEATTARSSTDPRSSMVDTIIVGGGAAGLTAALVLARALRAVVLVDDLSYRNVTVEEFHGFPGRDATPPADFRADVQRELRSYGVTTVTTTVTDGISASDHVTITFADGTNVRARTAVIATGVRDELPPIEGLAARWGKSAFNCPFCDGWEHRDLPVVVIDAGPGAEHLATMLRSWTCDVTLVEAGDIAELKGPGNTLETIELCDGTSIRTTAAFVRAPMSPRSAIARRLGCAIDEDGYIVTDDSCATSRPGVWAAGDIRRPPPTPHQVVLAAADGSTAAISIHKALIDLAAAGNDNHHREN
jgi:thioredoxin reductase